MVVLCTAGTRGIALMEKDFISPILNECHSHFTNAALLFEDIAPFSQALLGLSTFSNVLLYGHLKITGSSGGASAVVAAILSISKFIMYAMFVAIGFAMAAVAFIPEVILVDILNGVFLPSVIISVCVSAFFDAVAAWLVKVPGSWLELLPLAPGVFALYLMGIWVGLCYCPYSNNGWCADLAPLGAFISAFLWGPLTFLIISIVARFFVDEKKRVWLPLILTVFIMGMEGLFFNFSETRREGLLLASENGDVIKMKYWLLLGASPDSNFAGGNYALGLAVQSKSTKAVELLLQEGAEPSLSHIPLLFYGHGSIDDSMRNILAKYGVYELGSGDKKNK